MKKRIVTIMIGLIMLLAGVAIFIYAFTNADSEELITKNYEITEEVSNIEIDSKTSNVEIKVNEDEKIKVISLEKEKLSHNVVFNDGILKISQKSKLYIIYILS